MVRQLREAAHLCEQLEKSESMFAQFSNNVACAVVVRKTAGWLELD